MAHQSRFIVRRVNLLFRSAVKLRASSVEHVLIFRDEQPFAFLMFCKSIFNRATRLKPSSKDMVGKVANGFM